MNKINISDIGSDKNISTEEMAQVKGGPHFRTWDDIYYNTATVGNLTLKRG